MKNALQFAIKISVNRSTNKCFVIKMKDSPFICYNITRNSVAPQAIFTQCVQTWLLIDWLSKNLLSIYYRSYLCDISTGRHHHHHHQQTFILANTINPIAMSDGNGICIFFTLSIVKCACRLNVEMSKSIWIDHIFSLNWKLNNPKWLGSKIFQFL